MSLFPQGDTTELLGLRFDVAAVSEQGPRSENQDAYSVGHFARSGLVAVADGMGGERSGRVAADTALAALESAGPVRTVEDARRAVRAADAEVARTAEIDPEAHQGMGCALGLLALSDLRGDGPTWIAGHVGDVRIISRSPDGAVRLETRDHTPAFTRWEAGEISLDEIADTQGANRLQRAVGRGGEADVTWFPARPGWSWLIVSDGVYKAMRLDELAELMAMRSAAAACDALKLKVEERGPDDNYTAVLVRAMGGPAAATSPQERTEPMMHLPTRTTAAARGGAWGPIAAVLALLALALSGYALWSVAAGPEQAQRAEIERLRTEVDSLRAQVNELSDPFGPQEGEPAGTVSQPPPDASGPAAPVRP
jgi:serine/threonine protein phosphatase PrpC